MIGSLTLDQLRVLVTIADSIMGDVMSSSRCRPRLGFTRSRQPTS